MSSIDGVLPCSRRRKKRFGLLLPPHILRSFLSDWVPLFLGLQIDQSESLTANLRWKQSGKYLISNQLLQWTIDSQSNFQENFEWSKARLRSVQACKSKYFWTNWIVWDPIGPFHTLWYHMVALFTLRYPYDFRTLEILRYPWYPLIPLVFVRYPLRVMYLMTLFLE